MIDVGKVRTLYRKDMVDGIRESRVIISLITPIILAVFYNVLFPENKAVEYKVAYAGPETSALVQTLVDRAKSSQSVDLKLTHVATADEARALVTNKTVDAAFSLPADVDDAIRAGRSPSIALYAPDPPTNASGFVESTLGSAARTLAGQKAPAVIATESVKTGGAIDTGAVLQLGTRRYFVLASIVMMIGMVAVLAVPIMLTEEVEKKTLDALLLVSGYLDVIVAKAAVGLTYTGLAVFVMLQLTRLRPDDLRTFMLGVVLMSACLIGLGLLVGGLFKSAQQVYSWSSVMLIPVIVPAFAAGLPAPEPFSTILGSLPTSQGMMLVANGLAGHAIFPDVAQTIVVLVAWSALFYGVLAWRLSRRES